MSNQQNTKNIHYYRSALKPRLGLIFFSVDASVFVLVFIIFIFQNWYVTYAICALIAFFAILENLGMSLNIFVGRSRAFIAGKNRYVGQHNLRRRRFLHDR